MFPGSRDSQRSSVIVAVWSTTMETMAIGVDSYSCSAGDDDRANDELCGTTVVVRCIVPREERGGKCASPLFVEVPAFLWLERTTSHRHVHRPNRRKDGKNTKTGTLTHTAMERFTLEGMRMVNASPGALSITTARGRR